MVKFTFQSVFGNSRQNPRHASARDLIGQHQNKRFYVTEIVLPLGFTADIIFRSERSDDRKYVCGSQARWGLAAQIALSCIVCCIFNIISILFNCSDTATRVAKAMVRAIAGCFAKFALFLEFRARTRPQDLWPFLLSEAGLKFLIWTQGEIGLGSMILLS